MGSGGTGGDAAQSGISQVPATSHCNSVADWDPTWTQYEDEVLVHVNDARATGYNCDSEGRFGATTPLKMDPALRCAARLHSRYMGETGDFNHVTRTGSDPFDRIEEAGYRFWTAGENIAYGSPTPSDVVDGWLDSDGHCRNIMAPDFEDIGVGYFPVIEDNRWGSREAPYWTQAFGSAR